MEYTLRKWKKTDASCLAKYANNKNVSKFLRDVFPYPYKASDAASFISMALRSDPSKNMFRCIDVDGESVGGIGVFVRDDVYRKSAEIGYWLAEPYWGNGIVTDAAKQIVEMAFDTFDIVRIYAEIYAPNTASQRVLQKAGFVCEGTLRASIFKDGELMDSVVYALIRLPS